MKLGIRRLGKTLVPLLLMITLAQPVMAAPVELALEDCIVLALKNNPDIKIANADRAKYYWAVKQAEAGKGATVTFTHTDTRYNTPPTSTTPHYTWTTKFENEIELSLPIYTGGKLEKQVEQAKLNLEVADLDIAATEQQLTQTVTTYYYNVLQYRNELAVSQETVDNYVSHLKNVQAQYDAGIVAQSDVLASEVSLANAQNNLIKAKNNYEVAVSTLCNEIGLPHDTEVLLKDEFEQGVTTPALNECLKYALNNRPEMDQYQKKITIAGKDVDIAKSGYRPTVSFVATQDWYDKDFPGSDNSNWLVGLTASLNLFDSGLTDSKVKQAKYSLATASEQAVQKRDAILLEVRQYFLNMQEAHKRIETSKVAVDQAADNLRIAEVRYAAGVGTNLDVLDAVLSLNKAKTNYTQALYDYNTNRAQLEKAMGVAVK